MHYTLFKISLDDINLIDNVNQIFHVSDYLRLFMISFIYGLICSRYSSVNSVLFLSPLLSYSITRYYKNYQP